MNDAIDTKLCSLEYITVDNVADVALSLVIEALIAKIDIKSAYRLIPVCPADRKWLGMQWQDRVYVDGMLPFQRQKYSTLLLMLWNGVRSKKGWSSSSITWTILLL